MDVKLLNPKKWFFEREIYFKARKHIYQRIQDNKTVRAFLSKMLKMLNAIL